MKKRAALNPGSSLSLCKPSLFVVLTDQCDNDARLRRTRLFSICSADSSACLNSWSGSVPLNSILLPETWTATRQKTFADTSSNVTVQDGWLLRVGFIPAHVRALLPRQQVAASQWEDGQIRVPICSRPNTNSFEGARLRSRLRRTLRVRAAYRLQNK